MATLIDLDGLALTTIAKSLPLASVAALAATCRHFHSVLADDVNDAFWKRVACEVWGVVVDSPGALPRLPGGAGAGAEAGSWKETCVAHSRLLSRYSRDVGTRAARAWHRIENALATFAPDVLPTLAPGRTLSEPEEEEGMHNEVLAAAALHDGQEDFLGGGLVGRRGITATRRAQLGLFGSAVIYGDGFSRWMTNLLPRPGQARKKCLIAPVRGSTAAAAGGTFLLLHEIGTSLPAHDPLDVCDGVEGSSSLVLDLDSAAVFVRCPQAPPRPGPTDPFVPPEFPVDPVRRADGSRGLLSFLAELATALETRQLGAESNAFFRGGAMRVSGLGAAAVMMRLWPTRGLSRFAAAPPGLASREAAAAGGALVCSRSVLYTWMSQVFFVRSSSPGLSRYGAREVHVFSYRVSFRLLSLRQQRQRLQQLGQLGLQRVIRRATLVSRHWEIRPGSMGEEVEVVDGEGVVGFTPTLVAKDDDGESESGRGENIDGSYDDDDDDDGEDGSSFCYCSRVSAPEDPGEAPTELQPPGTRLGSFGGHFVFRIEEHEDGSTGGHVEVPVEPFEMVVPSVMF